MSAAQKATRWLRKAIAELEGATLTVDEATSLVIVRSQLDEAIMAAGDEAYGSVRQENAGANKAEAQRAFEEHDRRRAHLKSVPMKPEEEQPDAT